MSPAALDISVRSRLGDPGHESKHSTWIPLITVTKQELAFIEQRFDQVDPTHGPFSTNQKNYWTKAISTYLRTAKKASEMRKLERSFL
jgi:hypothetical protein